MRKFILPIIALLCLQELSAQAWIQRTNFGGTGRHRASAFAIGNRGYIGSGHVNGNNINISYKDWWQYDPSSDAWTQISDFPVYTYGAISFATSVKGYVGGGAGLASEFYQYDPQTNLWTAIANCPVSPGDQGSFAVNDKGYVIMGGALYEYDPATDSWTAKASAPMTFASWCNAFSVGSSGYVKSGTFLYEYKPLNNTWIQKALFPGLATNSSGALVRGGKAYIITGFVNSLANVTSEVWEYDPGSNTWSRMNDFPGTSRRFSVAFTINDRGYFGTGTNGINLNDFWEMNDNVGMNEITFTNIVMKTYPNPADEVVYFDLNYDVTATASTSLIRLYALTGEVTDEAEVRNGKATIGRGAKADGIYLYELIIDGVKVNSGKVLFQKQTR